MRRRTKKDKAEFEKIKDENVKNIKIMEEPTKENVSAIMNVCRKQLDVHVHKVKYALTTGLLNGVFKSLENYGIELNANTFSIFYDAVSEKLSGTSKVEHEWTEEEYKAIMQIHGTTNIA